MVFDRKIDVYIISSSHERRQPLIEKLSTCPTFQVFIEPSIFATSEMVKDVRSHPTAQLFEKWHGRLLTRGEIGASLAHNKVRMKIMENSRPSIVFEDDARISDLFYLESAVFDFLSRDEVNDGAVLSLFGEICQKTAPQEKTSNHKFVKLFGEPTLAVASLITPKAAERLVAKGSDGAWVADWAPTLNRYFVLCPQVVFHGDDTTVSVIDQSGVRNPVERPARRKVRKSLLVSFFNPKQCKFISLLVFQSLRNRFDLFRFGAS